ncbi:MAG: SAM-dependent methyltransferase [Clostridia bacterium]|nr:SAM-dependent methyltransferase [Clostridia bacterium]
MLDPGNRLKMAAAMVRPGSRVADIGTDHAYLPVYLILNGTIPSALACDLRQGPLCNAQKTVAAYGLEAQITLRLSDGFDRIDPSEAEDFVLCGMGGTLMAQLLGRTPWLKDPTKRLILQPQSHEEDVRGWLLENGFSILREDACTDDGKLYACLTAAYTGTNAPFSPAAPYIGALPQCGKPEALLKLKKTRDRLRLKAAHCPPAQAQTYAEILKELEATIDALSDRS